MLTCGNCGTTGQHITSECPYTAELGHGGKPPWCGNCDKATRLVDHGHSMARCAACHPLAWKPLAQHKRCGGCNSLIYTWDNRPCGQHQQAA